MTEPRSRIPIWRPIRAAEGAAFKPLPLEPVTGAVGRLKPATTLSRGRALSAARYISVDARPFMKTAAAAATGPPTLLFLCHSPDGQQLHIICAYHLLTNPIGFTPPCNIHIQLRRQTAYISTISAVPGLATGTTWVEITKAFCAYLGIKRIDIHDASTRYCATATDTHASYSYSLYLAYRRGTTFYEGLGFQHTDATRWRRLVASAQSLPDARVQAELRTLVAALPAKHDGRQRLEEALRIWSHITCPTPSHTACTAAVLSCKGFAHYETVLYNIKDILETQPPRAYPALRLLLRILDASSGSRRLQLGGAAAAEEIEETELNETHTVIDGLTYSLYDNRGLSVTRPSGRIVATFVFNRRTRRLFVHHFPPSAAKRSAVFAQAARIFGVTRIYLYILAAAFLDPAAFGAQLHIPTNTGGDFDTPEAMHAAVDAALRIVRATPIADLLADVDRWQTEASATLAHVDYLARGDIRYTTVSSTSEPARERRAEIRKAAASWGTHFPVAYQESRAEDVFWFLSFMPNAAWLHGRRHHREAFWKAVNVLVNHVYEWVWFISPDKTTDKKK